MGKLYLYSPIEKLYWPRDLDMDGDYGGRLFKVAKVRGLNLYYLVDSMHIVIGFMREKVENKEEPKKEVKKEIKKEISKESKGETFGEKMARIKREKN